MAAQALAAAFRQRFPHAPPTACQIIDPFAQTLNALPPVLEYLNAWSRQYLPALYDGLWRHGIPSGMYQRVLGLRVLRRVLEHVLQQHRPQIIVATHALPCALAAEIAEGLPVYGVVTDFGAHPFWPLSGVAGYFVPHEDVRHTFMYRGFPGGRVFTTGIPLRPIFQERFTALPLPISRPERVLLVAGAQTAQGYPDLEDLVMALAHRIPALPVHLTIVTGRNQVLQQRLTEIALLPVVTVRGYVDDMAALLAEHHIVLSKPGGLMVAESLAAGRPLLLLRPGAGQERANEEFLARHGAALPAYTAEQVIAQLQRLHAEPDLWHTLQSHARRLGRPQAAAQVLERLLREHGS